MVQNNSSFLDQCLKAIAILALIGLSGFGGWYIFKEKLDDDIGVAVRDLAKQMKPEPVQVVHRQSDLEEKKTPESLSTRDIVAKVLPGVVTISTNRSTGSGIFVRDARTVITNQHVMAGATEAHVVLQDKTRVRVTGYTAISPGRDLVAIQLDQAQPNVPVLELAPTVPQIGDRVLTCGAPLALSGTVSEGIVSAIRDGQELRGMMQAISHADFYSDNLGYIVDATWIQTSAPISPGNSGGPLVNEYGKVIGLMTFSNARGQNLNFAIAAQHARDMLDASDGELKPLVTVPPMTKSQQPRQKTREQVEEERERNRANEERRTAEAAAKKKIDDAEAAKAQMLRDEKAAESKLRAAEALLKAGKSDGYRKLLAEIVDKYPQTKAAEKARRALK